MGGVSKQGVGWVTEGEIIENKGINREGEMGLRGGHNSFITKSRMGTFISHEYVSSAHSHVSVNYYDGRIRA